MVNKLNINYLINNIIYTINNHFKGHTTSPILTKYLSLITTGMILNYGEDYIEDIYDTILTTNYCLSPSKNTLSNVLNYQNPTQNNYLEQNLNIKSKNNSYTILFQEIDSSPIKTLEFLTYKLNYILFNKHQKKSLTDNIKLKLSYFNNHFILNNDTNPNLLENIFNIIQTEAIIKIILKLDINNIKNKEFKNSILEYQNIDINTYQVEGLDIFANLFKPLYNHKRTKNIIDSYNNIELIKKELDTTLGKNTYKNTYNQLLKIYNLMNSNNTKYYFELSNYYVDIRNNVINKYLNYI